MDDGSFKSISSEEERVRKVIERLGSEFQIDRPSERSPFLSLVGTVLSQNTNRQNAKMAFENLVSKYTTPSEFLEADLGELEGLIRPAGLYRSKARTLKDLATTILNEYGGDLGKLLREQPDEAREELLDMPGVGPKTADCVLLFAGGHDVLPVDTHVSRTAKRLGFVDLEKKPEGVKKELEPLIPEGRRGKSHLLLIELGRKYCKALNPVCRECPIEDLCPRVRAE